MARHRDLKKHPRDYLPPDRSDWLAPGELVREKGVREARFVRIIGRRLDRLIAKDGRPVIQIAKRANLAPQTIHNILEGKTWCDAPTIWRLENALEERLWVNDSLEVEEADPRTLTPRYRRPGGGTSPIVPEKPQ